MNHIDLFSGIGGFALAAQEVWGSDYHNLFFCDHDPFCKKVLKKRFPNSIIYSDIRTVANSAGHRRAGKGTTTAAEEGHETQPRKIGKLAGRLERPHCDLLTGGFPCQPFSAAGRRKGTADDRYLWPEMFRVIRAFQPTWVIAENVRGLVTWEQGMVLEQVCLDLESEGYEVQPLIIPAVAVNAPHRRDRVWFVAHRTHIQQERREPERAALGEPQAQTGNGNSTTENIRRKRGRGWSDGNTARDDRQIQNARPGDSSTRWERHWPKVAAEFCSVDDGLPVELDGLKLSKSRHRAEQLKAYGNAIVPQVAMEIFKAIKHADCQS